MNIISVIWLLFFMIVGVTSLYLYIYSESYQQVKYDVDTLADVIAKKGGLPESDLDDFEKKIKTKYKFITKGSDDIFISVKTDIGDKDCIGTDDLNNKKGTYIASDDSENIVLTVIVPANNSNVLKNIIKKFELEKTKDTYEYERTIVSKRERPKEEDNNKVSKASHTYEDSNENNNDTEESATSTNADILVDTKQ